MVRAQPDHKSRTTGLTGIIHSFRVYKVCDYFMDSMEGDEGIILFCCKNNGFNFWNIDDDNR